MTMLTRPRKILAAVALAAVASFATAGLALADPNEVDDGGHHGGHTNSHQDQHSQGDDNNCNYKYNRDGSRSHKFHGGNHDCPTINPQINEPNPAFDHGVGSNPGGLPTGIPGVPTIP